MRGVGQVTSRCRHCASGHCKECSASYQGGRWLSPSAHPNAPRPILRRHQAANASFMRAHFDEDSARAALLLEQSSYCLLRAGPPMVRKFAFHLVLAGLRFHGCKQKRLAVHAYRQVRAAAREVT